MDRDVVTGLLDPLLGNWGAEWDADAFVGLQGRVGDEVVEAEGRV